MYEKYAKKANALVQSNDKAALMIQSTGSRANRNSIVRGQSISAIAVTGGPTAAFDAGVTPLEKKKSLKKIAKGVIAANCKFSKHEN